MARFGQGLIQGLINPGYELNTTGMMAGGLAGSIAARRQEEEKKAKVAQTVSTLMQDESPQRIRQGAASLFQDDPQAAAMLLDRAKEVAQRMAQLTGADPSAARKEQNAMRARLGQATDTAQAALEKQRKEEQEKALRASAIKAGVDQDIAQALPTESLSIVLRDTETKRLDQRLQNVSSTQQKNVMRGLAIRKGAPESILDDIDAGVFKDVSSLNDHLEGAGADIEEYQFQAGPNRGEVMSFPERDGKLLVNGAWVIPSQAGLVRAPTRTSEDASAKFTKMTPAQFTMAQAGAGVIYDLVNELESVKDVQGRIALSSVSPVATDFTNLLEAQQNIVPESLGRLLSGAAIKDDEMPRFNNMFSITFRDIISPQAAATKLVRSALLLNTDARLASGEIGAAEARQLVLEASMTSLTAEDKKKLASGEFRSVVKPKLESILDTQGTGKDDLESQANAILGRLGI